MIPLELSSKQQEFLAQLCSALRSWHYQKYLNEKQDKVTDELNYELIGDMEMIMGRFDFSPQDLDMMYDKLHRAGSNS